MGILGDMVKAAAVRGIISASADAVSKTIDAVGEYNAKRSNFLAFAPDSSEAYLDKNAFEVKREFEAFGFTNVVLLPKKKLIKGFGYHSESIISITINGKEKFKKGEKFNYDVRVVIQHWD